MTDAQALEFYDGIIARLERDNWGDLVHQARELAEAPIVEEVTVPTAPNRLRTISRPQTGKERLSSLIDIVEDEICLPVLLPGEIFRRLHDRLATLTIELPNGADEVPRRNIYDRDMLGRDESEEAHARNLLGALEKLRILLRESHD